MDTGGICGSTNQIADSKKMGVNVMNIIINISYKRSRVLAELARLEMEVSLPIKGAVKEMGYPALWHE